MHPRPMAEKSNGMANCLSRQPCQQTIIGTPGSDASPRATMPPRTSRPLPLLCELQKIGRLTCFRILCSAPHASCFFAFSRCPIIDTMLCQTAGLRYFRLCGVVLKLR